METTLAVYLFETGFKTSIPGIKRDFPAFTLPFWGEYYVFDIVLYNFVSATPNIYVFLNQAVYRIGLSIVDRWTKFKPEIIVDNGEIDSLIGHLQTNKSNFIVFSSFSCVSLFNYENLVELANQCEDGIIKVSLENTPVEVYIGSRKNFIKVLRKYRRRFANTLHLEREIFDNMLIQEFKVIMDLPGKLFFNSNINQIYRSNLELRSVINNKQIVNFLYFAKEAISGKSDSYISNEGFVKDSYIASGTHIEGYIKNSVIFPGVMVKSGSKIIDSVIMNNNVICRDSTIVNSLILPNTRENKPGECNIGMETVIGGKRGTTKNFKYPSQIRDGLTVIGFNPDIPHGAVIGKGCVIEADVNFSRIREVGELRRGKTIDGEGNVL